MDNDNAFDVLEDKVRKAAELVQRLRAENGDLERQAAEARAKLEEAEHKLQTLAREQAGAVEAGRELDTARREVQTLRHEREQVRTRIARMVELLEGLD